MASAEDDPQPARDEAAVERILRLGLPRPMRDTPSFFRRPERERPAPAAGLHAGKVVGDFQLVALIGEGGMAQVWEAVQLSLGKRRVALKFVRPERVTAHGLELFAREARAGGRLNHPGIVTVHGHGSADGLAWLALELVEGAWTLKDFLDEARRAPELPADYDRHVARVVAEVAEAMHVAHAAGVIHRDLKPQNVLLTEDDRPKVTDFGLARITDEAALSVSGSLTGTFAYMSPEQVAAHRAGIDHRTDVFSLGVVLYELLALRRPFEGDTTHQIAAQILTRDPPEPRTIRSRVPRDLAVIATKALEKQREKRFQSMGELAADLRRFLAHEPIHARPPTRRDRALKWTRRHPVKSVTGAVAATAFAIISFLLVANVRANRALAAKTSESEERREQAEEQRGAALASATRERERADEVLRLSALQRLEDLEAEADHLWPALPENLEKYDAWMRRAGALIAELPDHERKLAELKAHGVLRTIPAEEHPRWSELERTRRHLAHCQRTFAALSGTELPADPPPVDVDAAALPTHGPSVAELAWSLIAPDRQDWGAEAKGLALARYALELAAELAPSERARVRNTLAWALFANGLFDEAMAQAEQAVAESEEPELERSLERLGASIEAEIDPERDEERQEQIEELAGDIAALEAEVLRPPQLSFVDDQDKWWHNQVEQLVDELKGFSDPETGLASGGTSPDHGWGVERRREFARTIRERSVAGGEASARWAEAIASLADPKECPRYGGLRITPQLGLLPLGQDPESGLWEFAHLQTGDPAQRGADGGLVSKAETGLVFVLLPGGTFWMGAQSSDPNGPNYDPNASDDEGPVHEVTLSAFFLSKYEMTQGQWERSVGSNSSFFSNDALHPVENVSWLDCRDAMDRMELALPSEAQWEYGARGGTRTAWWTGSSRDSLLGAANLADRAAEREGAPWAEIKDWPELDDGQAAHAPANEFRANAFGLYNVHGNVWEWCLDGEDGGSYEQASSVKDPVTPPERSSHRAVRGGSFTNGASNARSASRSIGAPSHKSMDLGLRPARRVDP